MVKLSKRLVAVIVSSTFVVVAVLVVVFYFFVIQKQEPRYELVVNLPPAVSVTTWEGHNSSTGQHTVPGNLGYPKPEQLKPFLNPTTLPHPPDWKKAHVLSHPTDTVATHIRVLDWDFDHLRGIDGVYAVDQTQYHARFFQKSLVDGEISWIDPKTFPMQAFRFVRGHTMIHGLDLSAAVWVGHTQHSMETPHFQLFYRDSKDNYMTGELRFNEDHAPFAPLAYPPTNPVVFSMKQSDGTHVYLVGVLLGRQVAHMKSRETFSFDNWVNSEGRILWFTIESGKLQFHSTTKLDGLYVPPGAWTASNDHLMIWGSRVANGGIMNRIRTFRIDRLENTFWIRLVGDTDDTVFEEDNIVRIKEWVETGDSKINEWPKCSTVFTTNASGTILVAGETRGEKTSNGKAVLAVLRRAHGGTSWVRERQNDISLTFPNPPVGKPHMRGWIGPGAMVLDGSLLTVLLRDYYDYAHSVILSYRFDFLADHFMPSPDGEVVRTSYRSLNRMPLYVRERDGYMMLLMDGEEDTLIQYEWKYQHTT